MISLELSKSILITICYYDVFDYPLTSFEIWKYMLSLSKDEKVIAYPKYALGDVLRELANNGLRKHIDEKNGFYFLNGRESLVDSRIERNKLSINKYRIAGRVAWWLHFLPFVRMVAVTGTLAMKNPTIGSDLDFLITIQQGRIWIGRTLVTGVVHLLGKRRYGNKIKDRVCLNHYLATDGLEINRQDLFAANEYTFICPLFGFEEYRNFLRTNRWVFDFKPNYLRSQVKPEKTIEHSEVSYLIQKIFEGLINTFGGNLIEQRLMKWQTKRIQNNPLTQSQEGYIEFSNKRLIFIPNPQGPRIFEAFKLRLKTLIGEKA